MNSVKYLWSNVPFLSVTPFVCFKTSEPQELGTWNFICDYIFIYREYLLLTYAAGTLLDHTPPPSPQSVTPFVCFKTSEPQELGTWNFICDYIFIYREYLLLTYAAGTLLDHTPPQPPPPPPRPKKNKKKFFFPDLDSLSKFTY